MLKRIDHIEFIVRNMDEFIVFFQKMGFRLLSKTEHQGGSVEMALPGPSQAIFEIHAVRGMENPCISHIAFVTNDIEADTEELKKKSFEFESECHYVEATGRTISNFRNPDGFRFQLVDERKEEPIAGKYGKR